MSVRAGLDLIDARCKPTMTFGSSSEILNDFD